VVKNLGNFGKPSQKGRNLKAKESYPGNPFFKRGNFGNLHAQNKKKFLVIRRIPIKKFCALNPEAPIVLKGMAWEKFSGIKSNKF